MSRHLNTWGLGLNNREKGGWWKKSKVEKREGERRDNCVLLGRGKNESLGERQNAEIAFPILINLY